MSKLTRVIYFMLGVAFTQIVGPTIQSGWDRGYDIWCGGSVSLAQGKAALANAIKENRPELINDAKVALEKSASCCAGGEARFLLGLLYCNGLGVEKDVPRGRRLLRDAISREPQWAMEIQANPKLCKAGD